ncbi:tRNA (adenosine(37)-N6)-threonylcarbamoyltransferase complex dimerization subunit type 1 TsaB [Georgenia yuyongxinii]|uniref:tRNA (Adenosine(37)-N6)-threonylcarbamoyltransferase complex dimerization subunit type 1 TsaB n=1 Tax=Georgenia yuyongxinii TaxID=2589797 RepID=A0A552WSH7_9MICO|nr:tRNA (adenosine(37)-N6)-threonylcarbamoyltransferase complex dimerization subunit type 1 TsaB [Georgenia yuyongxinii]TRW45549.1 tRNA (adenosine(37)-N6)-threonylcarbamoyltransferase complex dimerization subunit type 1 TsaB [Georgenia yuyongxinii]
MRILCLDTSSGSAVALTDAPAEGPVTVLGAAHSPDPRRHAESLAPMTAELLPAGSELGAVAVGTGPAPFTGLRVGLITAAALGRARGVEVHGVCSLDVLARQALDLRPDDEVLVATDARRKEVYWARYRARGADDVERLTGPEVGPAARAAEDASGALVAGAGAGLYPEQLPPTTGLPTRLDPAVLARLVRARLARRAAGERVELGTEPRYLRRPDVHVAAAPKRAT